jgi:hypothetical protein
VFAALSSQSSLSAQPTPPDNKCDSLQFLSMNLNVTDASTLLIFAFKNNSAQNITDIQMKLEPTELSGLGLENDIGSHPDVIPGQIFSVIFPLTGDLAELDLNITVTGELITLPHENEFKCVIPLDKNFINPELSLTEAQEFNVLVYPNPASNYLIVETDQENAFFQLYDASGRQQQLVGEFNGRQWTLKWDRLAKGFYILHESQSNSYKKIQIH